MHILVRTISGKTLTLLVESSETIGSIKAKIQEVERIHPDKQYPMFNGNYLEDGLTLSDIGIENGSTLHLGLQIFVNTGDRLRAFKVVSSDTIGSVKAKIEELEGTPAEAHRLVFGAKPLEDTQTLLQYNIHNEATLHMMFRLKGGITSTSP